MNTQRRPEKLICRWRANSGYLAVTQKTGAECSKHLVHRLVARAFVPGEFPGASVNHKDGNKLNNVPENLEWLSLADNTRHQWRTGLIDLRGEKHPLAKLTSDDVAEIRRRLLVGHRAVRLSKEFSVSVSLIYKIGDGTKRRV